MKIILIYFSYLITVIKNDKLTPISRSYSWNGEKLSLALYDQKTNGYLKRANSMNDFKRKTLAANRFTVMNYKYNRKSIYECNEYVFNNYEDAKAYSDLLRKKAVQMFQKKPKKCLYKKKSSFDIVSYEINGKTIYECGVYGFESYEDAKEYQRKIYKNSIKDTSVEPKGSVRKSTYINDITWYSIKGTRIYECGDYGFHDYSNAAAYCKYLQSNNFINSMWKPKGCVSESRHKINDFDITDFLGANPLGIDIWKKIWGNCDYSCFSKKGFSVFKKKLNEEINAYRKLHGSKGLKMNLKLCIAAQKHANKIAKTKTLSHASDYYVFGVTFGLAYYRAASTVALKWYEEGERYNFMAGKKVPGTQMFTQMLWNKSIRLGVGIAMVENMIVVVCKYWPKGNLEGEYKKNVFFPLNKLLADFK
uniref:SCP domain-containing protein n=1 Tax=Strongyloides stercoralis TaxID=6248 RepID=A0A0K0E3K4_STRER